MIFYSVKKKLWVFRETLSNEIKGRKRQSFVCLGDIETSGEFIGYQASPRIADGTKVYDKGGAPTRSQNDAKLRAMNLAENPLAVSLILIVVSEDPIFLFYRSFGFVNSVF